MLPEERQREKLTQIVKDEYRNAVFGFEDTIDEAHGIMLLWWD
jgi:hypothetical protein